MMNLISRAIAPFASRLKGLQVQRLVSIVLVGFLLLTSNGNPNLSNPGLTQKVQERAHQNTDQRPKTTGEWMNEARQDAPIGERIQQIAEDSADAFKEFGSGYIKGAKKTANDVQRLADEAGKDLSNSVR